MVEDHENLSEFVIEFKFYIILDKKSENCFEIFEKTSMKSCMYRLILIYFAN